MPASPRIEDLIHDCLEGDPAGLEERLQECCAAHPEYADAIRAGLAKLRMLGLLDDDTVDTVWLEGVTPTPGAVPLPDAIGGFEVVRLLGSGGMGVVYEARQPALGGRRVALKVIRSDLTAVPQARERFRREAALASRLDHPHACDVLQAGEHDGMPFLAMRYVEGETLQSLLGRARATGVSVASLCTTAATTCNGAGGMTQGGDWRTIVAMFEKLADALHAAHLRSLVHRDVKPANVMIRPDGEPVLLDFGLARDVDDHGLSRSGDAIGTPVYMAPEQTRGERRALDARTDVWGLAVVMFETLTGTLPFEGETRETLYEAIRRQPVPDARRRATDGLPTDVQTVLEKALEKNPDRRYATARAFADDLGRCRRREPIRARRIGVVGCGWRWVERNRLAATFLGVLTTAFAITVVLLAILAARDTELRARVLAAESGQALGESQVVAMHLAVSALEQALDTPAESSALDQLHIAMREVRECAILRPPGPPRRAMWSRDGAHVLAVTVDGTVCRWTRNGEPRGETPTGLEVWSVVPIELGGATALALADLHGTIHVWREGQPLRLLWRNPVQQRGYGALAASSDGKRLALGLRNGQVRVWSGLELEHCRVLNCRASGHPRDSVTFVDVFDDGRVACGTYLGHGMVWPPDGEEPGFLERFPGADAALAPVVSGVFPLADGVLMTTGATKEAYLFRDGDVSTRIEHPGGIFRAERGAAGLVATMSDSWRGVRLWDPGSENLVAELVGHAEMVQSVDLRLDLGRIVTGSWDLTIGLWDGSGQPLARLTGHDHDVLSVELDPAGERIVSSALRDGTVRVWDTAPCWQEARSPDYPVAAYLGLRRGRSSEDLFVFTSRGIVERIDPVRRASRALTGIGPACLNCAVSDAGDRLFLVRNFGNDQELSLLDADSGETIATGESRRILGYVGLGFASGDQLWSVQTGGARRPPAVRVYTVVEDRIVEDEVAGFTLPAWELQEGYLAAADADHDLRWFAVGAEDSTIQILSADGQLAYRAAVGSRVRKVEFDPSGRHVGAALVDGRVLLFSRDERDAWSHRLLTIHDRHANYATFHPTLPLVATCSMDGTARVVDFDGKVVRQFSVTEGKAYTARFSLDGRHLHAAVSPGVVRTWLLDADEALEHARRLLPRPLTRQEHARYADLLGAPR